ncbi:hypothetical protein BS618_07540 [Rhodococcus erythropolis]|uniref:hypothetical protein n=1 Tax=Rhodococcus qingshengii TaxID=334542 RepID=UPI000935F8DC|nr:hypothetical protein [Rhodococcus qingshengii]MCZ4544926.1 hypothetical protein [Rhodococcus qingshengii]OKA15780.1 hypothetical protein BS618_07540 [Rhodococcus erythropolis]
MFWWQSLIIAASTGTISAISTLLAIKFTNSAGDARLKNQLDAERQRQERELQARWGKEILEYAMAYITGANQIFDPNLVHGAYIEPDRRAGHDLTQLTQSVVEDGQRLQFVAPTLRPQIVRVFTTTMDYYQLEIKQENRDSQQFADVAQARAEFSTAVNKLLGVSDHESTLEITERPPSSGGLASS